MKRKVIHFILPMSIIVSLIMLAFPQITLADDTGLTLIGSINPGVDNIRPASSVFVRGDYAYLAAYNLGWFVIDVADPATPILVGSTTSHPQYGFDPYDIHVDGDYAYMPQEDGYFVVADVSDPANPDLALFWVPDPWIPHGDGIYVKDNYAYMVGGSSTLPGYMHIIDISDPLNPDVVGSYSGSATEYYKAVYVIGNYAYVADFGEGGIRIFDVADPTDPVLVGSLLSNISFHLYVSGQYAYVAAMEAGLVIIDISDPVNPVSVGTLDTEGLSQGVWFEDNYVYLADSEAGLKVIDVSDPKTPFLVDSYVTDGIATDVFKLGQYIYLAVGNQGLKIFTFNQPPVANAGPDQTVEADTVGGAQVTLDGSGSSDPDSDPLTYAWSWDSSTATGVSPAVFLPLGTTTVTLVVNDGTVDSEPDTVDITVVDTTLPEITVSVSPDALWPPNHKMVEITATVTVSDVTDPSPSVVLTSITSNESGGDSDIQEADYGTEDYTFLLRAERDGKGYGRVYTISYTVTDASGNSATGIAIVNVPHDKGKKK